MRTRDRPRLAALLAAAASCLACVGTAPPPPSILDGSAADAVAALERRLMEAREVRVACSATAEGVLAADLDGTLALTPDGVEIRHRGTFVDNPADLDLRVDGGRLIGGNGDRRLDAEVPPALREAVVVGLTRMGILHNLARLSGAMAPDHADGGVAEWATLDAAAWGETAEVDGTPARAVEFGLLVDGEPSADVRLWLDADTGLPLRREQTVHFPQGEMRVVERYLDWSFGEAR